MGWYRVQMAGENGMNEMWSNSFIYCSSAFGSGSSDRYGLKSNGISVEKYSKYYVNVNVKRCFKNYFDLKMHVNHGLTPILFVTRK